MVAFGTPDSSDAEGEELVDARDVVDGVLSVMMRLSCPE